MLRRTISMLRNILHRTMRWAAWVIGALILLMLLYRIIPPVSTLMLQRYVMFQPVHRQWVPLADISPRLVRAVIVSEDAGFCTHHGVDWKSLYAVLRDRNGPGRGASTISMQLTRNLFLWQGRSYLRKALEIPLTLTLELLWPKRRILEAYLNLAEWGDGIFGIEAATQKNFHHSARSITAREAELLVVSLPNPRKRHAARAGEGLKELASDLAERVATEGADTRCLAR